MEDFLEEDFLVERLLPAWSRGGGLERPAVRVLLRLIVGRVAMVGVTGMGSGGMRRRGAGARPPRAFTGWLGLACAVVGLAACAGGSSAAPATVTASSTQTVPATASARGSGLVARPLTTSPAPRGGPAAGLVVVPAGVGLDYQRAQDLWRRAGLHVAPAVDALGAHRLPVIDSHWIVLSQSPKAGSRVSAGSFITATVKKKTDG